MALFDQLSQDRRSNESGGSGDKYHRPCLSFAVISGFPAQKKHSNKGFAFKKPAEKGKHPFTFGRLIPIFNNDPCSLKACKAIGKIIGYRSW
jgi:hypothetical protein